MAAEQTGRREADIGYIDDSPLFQAVCAPVPAQRGEPLEENELFDAIDTEMMKRGTLAHASIRWEWICEQAALLLRTEAKDFRLILFIVQSLPHTEKFGPTLPLAAALISRFAELWGESAYPPAKGRGIWVKKLADAFIAAASLPPKIGLPADLANFTVQKMRQCAAFFKPYDAAKEVKIQNLASHIEAGLLKDKDEAGRPSLEKLLKEPASPKMAAPAAKPERQPDAAAPVPEVLALDSNNERALKQSLIAVADFLLETDIANPLSYRLRRFATWHGIKNPPERKRREENKTVIMPVSANAADEYRSAVARGQMDINIVRRLERSCYIQPFWLEGQYFACRLAAECGRAQAAAAIYEETAAFFARAAWLAELQFADGSPFMPPETKTWLEHYQQQSAAAGAGGQNEMIDREQRDIFRAAKEKAAQGKTGEAIAMLEQARPASGSMRSQALWEMLMMESLNEWGLKKLAALQSGRLADYIKNMPVHEFEPELIERINYLAAK